MFFKAKIVFHWLLIKSRKGFRSRKELKFFQQKKLKEFAQKVLMQSPFYQPFCTSSTIEWSQFPLMSKQTFMENFDSINTCGLTLKEAMPFALAAEKTRAFNHEINGITVGLSTGTSGNRGLFIVSENERALWVALVMARVIQPRLFKKQKIAFFLRANSNLYASVSSSLFEFKYFDIFQPIEDLLQELNSFQPHIVAAQPSILMDIAMAQREKSIQVQPTQIISFAEVLHQPDKAFIQHHLKANITEVYQCTEGFLGATCAHGTMHLHEDFIHFDKDWIDEDKFYPIITDFSRTSQPIVRYKLNDILQVKKEECLCGSMLLGLEKIMGRDDDVLVIHGKRIYPDLLVRRIAIKCNEFQNYRIVQVQPELLEVHIACDKKNYDEMRQSFQEAILTLLNEQGINGIQLEFKHQVVRVSGNKLRKVINKL